MANRQIKYEPHIIDNLTSTSTSDALSANQGKVLNDKIENPTVKIGTFEANSGVTVNELRVKQTGKVVEVHFWANVGNTSANPYRFGYVRNVDLPSQNIRTITGTGSTAYEAIHPAYIILGTSGGIEIYRSQISDTAVNVDFVYTVD